MLIEEALDGLVSASGQKKKKNKLKGKTKGIQEYAHLTGVQTHR